jgi:hypothetical protein
VAGNDSQFIVSELGTLCVLSVRLESEYLFLSFTGFKINNFIIYVFFMANLISGFFCASRVTFTYYLHVNKKNFYFLVHVPYFIMKVKLHHFDGTEYLKS